MPGTVTRLNKTALVTGASSGIGRAVAVKLADEGYDLIVTARRMDLLEALVTELEGKGRRAEAYLCDLSSGDAREALLGYVKNTCGCPDLVVNNAGFAWYGYFAEMDWHTADEMIGVNNAAAVHLTLAFLPGMLARGGGQVINISSVAGDIPSQGVALYSASKAFLNAFSTALWRELQGKPVKVSMLLPGPVKTPFFKASKALSNGLEIPVEWLGVPVDAVTNALWSLVKRPRRVAYVPFFLALTPWVERIFGWIIDLLGPLLLRWQAYRQRRVDRLA